MEERSRPFALSTLARVLRTPVGWFVFQILEFLVVLWATREFADDLGIRWDLLLLISVVVLTYLNYRLRVAIFRTDKDGDEGESDGPAARGPR